MPSFICNCLYFRPYFHQQWKKELVEYLLSLESMMFGLTTNDVRNLAFQLAEKNNLPNSFNKAKRKAGKDWPQGFMHRHKELSLRQPEATSTARAKFFNSQTVNKFFDLFEAVMDKYKFPPQRIFNCDETGSLRCKASFQKF